MKRNIWKRNIWKQSIWKRLFELIFGTCCISFGIAFLSQADIGMSPISSTPFVLSKIFPVFTLGNLVLFWNMLFAVLQIPLEGKKYKPYLLTQIPLAFLLGYVTDAAKWLIRDVEIYWYPFVLLFCIVGVILTALGVYLTVSADLIMNGPEAFLHSLSSKLGKTFGSLKVYFDVANVVLAFVLSMCVFHKPIGLREGTIISAILTGVFVSVFHKLLDPVSIRKATEADMPRLREIYAIARSFMKQSGNPTQWGDNRPAESAILKDVKNGDSYVLAKGTHIYAVFSFIVGDDETYHVIEEGNWLNEEPYGVIHKVASSGEKKHILERALAYAESQVSNVRIDTHKDNLVMQHLLVKNGYQYCGIIYTDDGTKRLAYQKIV